MQSLKWILVFLIISAGCSEKVTTDIHTCYLRLVDSETKQHIANTKVLLIPRIILLKAARGTPNPNLQYALEIHTDKDGLLPLDYETLEQIFSYFPENGKVDCQVEGFSRFLISYDSTSIKYPLTVFDRNNKVAPSNPPFLIKGDTVEILLDRIQNNNIN